MQTCVQDFKIVDDRITRPADEGFMTICAMTDVALPALMIVRFTAPLYYANAESFMKDVLLFARDAPPDLRWFILRFDSIEGVDYVAAKILMELADRMSEQRVALIFTELCAEVKSFSPTLDFWLRSAQTEFSLQSTQPLRLVVTSRNRRGFRRRTRKLGSALNLREPTIY